ncbi:probable F-box protein At5g04010 [Impatiens glandulifera]|uniref:probable F-box protein At5g04010 n=1 Tax=Impatiens glandulifera TaxID=253017 RepID=UPI001FB17E92|nr:probable F-box protein At5g04010 [Impatiens glandulifera]
MSSHGMLKCPPPWKVLILVAATLDPKTLALATCVSKLWYDSLFNDEFWEPLCTLHFPAFATIHSAEPSMSFHRLYSLCRIFANRSIRRLRSIPEPILYLNDLVFTITAHIANPNTTRGGVVPFVATVARRLEPTLDTMFWFDLEIKDGVWIPREALKKTRITWNVSLEGYRAIFTMLDCKEESMGPKKVECWMSNELPSTRGFISDLEGSTSGFVAELQFEMKEEDGKVKVEKIGVGMFSVMNWRYLGVRDGLRYLKHFLLF